MNTLPNHMTDSQKKFLKEIKTREKLLNRGMSISFLIIWVILNTFIIYIAIQPYALEDLLQPILLISILLLECLLLSVVFLMAGRVIRHPFREDKELMQLSGRIEKGILFIKGTGSKGINMPIYHLNGYVLTIPIRWQTILSYDASYNMLIYPENKYYSLLERLLLRDRHRAIVIAIWTNDRSLDLSK